MNKNICKECIRKAMVESCYCEQDLIAHKENFDRFFGKLRNKFYPAMPCFLNYDENQKSPDCDMMYYKCIQHWYFFRKVVVAPEECPYILEHTVASC